MIDLFENAYLYPNLNISDSQHLLQHIATRVYNIFPDNSEVRIRSDLFAQSRSLESFYEHHNTSVFHVKLHNLNEQTLFFFRLKTPVTFLKEKDIRADLFYVLATPHNQTAIGLSGLSRLSRIVNDPTLSDKIRGADSEDAIRALLWSRSRSLKAA